MGPATGATVVGVVVVHLLLLVLVLFGVVLLLSSSTPAPAPGGSVASNGGSASPAEAREARGRHLFDVRFAGVCLGGGNPAPQELWRRLSVEQLMSTTTTTSNYEYEDPDERGYDKDVVAKQRAILVERVV
jgi:hypothetical protein